MAGDMTEVVPKDFEQWYRENIGLDQFDTREMENRVKLMCLASFNHGMTYALSLYRRKNECKAPPKIGGEA